MSYVLRVHEERDGSNLPALDVITAGRPAPNPRRKHQGIKRESAKLEKKATLKSTATVGQTLQINAKTMVAVAITAEYETRHRGQQLILHTQCVSP
jgi:hypothetical protein